MLQYRLDLDSVFRNGILFISGIALTLAFPPFRLWFLGWVSLVPLILYSLQEDYTFRERFIQGFIFGLGHSLTSFYWISYVVAHYGHLPYFLAIPVFMLLAAYLSLYPAVFAVACKLYNDGKSAWLGLPSLWILLEWVRAKLITGFPWNLVAYSQGSFDWIAQTADLWGPYGVGWLVILINTHIALWIMGRRNYLGCLFLIVALLFSCVYGSIKSEAYKYDYLNSVSSKKLSVSLVQGNIDQSHKWDKRFQDFTLNKYFSLTRKAISSSSGVRLIIWPETAMPFFFGAESELTSALVNFTRKIGQPLLFGSPGFSSNMVGQVNGFLNKAYLINKEGLVIGEYAKEHLVPFGEYVPMKKILFFVKRLVPATGDFVPGNFSGIVEFEDVKLGLLICYEAIFPELTRKRVLKGAEVLVNISNDAWFGRSSAPFQHLEMARWRAIESRKPLLRCTNTGISAIIDSSGRMLSSLPLFTDGFINGDVLPLEYITPYERFGDVFVVFCALTVFSKLVYVVSKIRKKGRRG